MIDMNHHGAWLWTQRLPDLFNHLELATHSVVAARTVGELQLRCVIVRVLELMAARGIQVEL